MGFDDRDIVALSGGHTVGRVICGLAARRMDDAALRFDNEYFRNLIGKTWVERKWSGNKQYTDAETGTLTMLLTDIALLDAFRPIVLEYANDQGAFFRDFSSAFSRWRASAAPTRRRRCACALAAQREAERRVSRAGDARLAGAHEGAAARAWQRGRRGRSTPSLPSVLHKAASGATCTGAPARRVSRSTGSTTLATRRCTTRLASATQESSSRARGRRRPTIKNKDAYRARDRGRAR